ncbi:hypothetical protein E9993_20050 [Labilibacter sediminis]|nr:hypothetical protein E9993_20050 [Labilibacter sediminis]
MKRLSKWKELHNVRLTVSIGTVDFETKEYDVDLVQSDAFDLASKDAVDINTTATISANSEKVVFVVLGIEYYQTVNRELYIINNMECRSLAMVAVNIP